MNETGRRGTGRDRARAMRVGVAGLELSKHGAARFDLRDPYHLAVSLSWPAFALAALGLEVGINVLFALFYLAQPGCVANARPGSFTDAFFFSLETLATVGYGTMSPATFYGHAVSAVEIVSGTAFTAIFTGLLFVRFSRPKARLLYADRAVITRHDGRPTLMLRVGNGRLSLLTDARARVGVMLAERSSEGIAYNRVHKLRLQRADLPVFALTWTLMHEIDEASPLHGIDPERLQKENMRLFVSIEARDSALGAQVQDMRTYGRDEVVFGMRFADAVSLDEAGHVLADLTRISLLEPDGTARDG